MSTSHTWGHQVISPLPKHWFKIHKGYFYPYTALGTVLHVETLLGVLMLAGDLECHTAQSLSRHLGGGTSSKELEKKAFDERSRYFM